MSDGEPYTTMDDADREHVTSRLRKLDQHLFAVLAEHIVLTRKIAQGFQETAAVTDRQDRRSRQAEVEESAGAQGLNPDFVLALLYFINDESSRIRLERIERTGSLQESGGAALSLATKRQNLLRLTEIVAPIFDTRYDERFFATRNYRSFERDVIDRAIRGLEHRRRAYDFGCATGIQTASLAASFESVVGYDISPAMIAQGRQVVGVKFPHRVKFVEADLDGVISEPDASASFVVMSLGTASELADPRATFAEISRLLVPGGRVFLSFYNKDALVYRIRSVPWPLSLAAEMNVDRQYLEVHIGSEVFPIHASAYSIEEAKTMLPLDLRVIEESTYPTISPLLPNELFDEEEAKRTIADIDHQLSSGHQGNYLMLVCQKDVRALP
jgi:SAM-dependent methyltransferase